MLEVTLVGIEKLKPNDRNARTHARKQVQQIADSITAFGFVNPILVDEEGVIIAGHGRHAALLLLGRKEVPVIVLRGLSKAKRRALAIADNKIAANAGWNRELLALELPELAEVLIEEKLEISITGFAAVEIDQLAADFEERAADAADEVDPRLLTADPVSKPGDLWQLGHHRLLCGDARDSSALEHLMDGCKADMSFLDPPYNLRVRDIVGRGEVQHAEFAMASGELSPPQFVEFLQAALSAAAGASRSGAIHYVCMDWRHLAELLEAGNAVYGCLLNLAVWVKTNAGQGSFYRSQHELVGVFRVGDAAHLNNIELGRHGRSRSNVWHYAGANAFRSGRMDDLKAHPTPKPIGLVADAMKDCTGRRGTVLDTFSGSGTTILAAERVGRRAFALELEPHFVDVALRRWQAVSGRDAIHIASGRSFDEIAGSAVNSAATPLALAA